MYSGSRRLRLTTSDEPCAWILFLRRGNVSLPDARSYENTRLLRGPVVLGGRAIDTSFIFCKI